MAADETIMHAMASVNGKMPAGKWVSVAEIAAHTGHEVWYMQEDADKGLFGPAKIRSGVRVYNSNKVNIPIICGAEGVTAEKYRQLVAGSKTYARGNRKTYKRNSGAIPLISDVIPLSAGDGSIKL